MNDEAAPTPAEGADLRRAVWRPAAVAVVVLAIAALFVLARGSRRGEDFTLVLTMLIAGLVAAVCMGFCLAASMRLSSRIKSGLVEKTRRNELTAWGGMLATFIILAPLALAVFGNPLPR